MAKNRLGINLQDKIVSDILPELTTSKNEDLPKQELVSANVPEQDPVVPEKKEEENIPEFQGNDIPETSLTLDYILNLDFNPSSKDKEYVYVDKKTKERLAALSTASEINITTLSSRIIFAFLNANKKEISKLLKKYHKDLYD